MKINIHVPTRLHTVSLCHAKSLSKPTFICSTAHSVCIRKIQSRYINLSQSAATKVCLQRVATNLSPNCNIYWVIQACKILSTFSEPLWDCISEKSTLINDEKWLVLKCTTAYTNDICHLQIIPVKRMTKDLFILKMHFVHGSKGKQ